MSGNIQENIDFDGDLSFSGKDLDISWAYLQVKALLDSGSSDVTVSNFRDKVIEQYNLNKSAGIAEPNDKEITSLLVNFLWVCLKALIKLSSLKNGH